MAQAARLTGKSAVAAALRSWRQLKMQARGVRELVSFTERKLRQPMYVREDGRFRYSPGKFLQTVWGPALLKARKARADARGETGAADVAGTMSAYLEHLAGGEA